jgi:hypothetical protein
MLLLVDTGVCRWTRTLVRLTTSSDETRPRARSELRLSRARRARRFSFGVLSQAQVLDHQVRDSQFLPSDLPARSSAVGLRERVQDVRAVREGSGIATTRRRELQVRSIPEPVRSIEKGWRNSVDA